MRSPKIKWTFMCVCAASWLSFADFTPKFVLAHNLTGHSDWVQTIAFSPDGRLLVSSGWDGKLVYWNVESGKLLRTVTAHDAPVMSVAFSPDGRLLASGGDDRLIKIWDVETGKELHTLSGITHYVLSLAFSPDGKRLAAGIADGTIGIWNSSTMQRVRTLNGADGAIMAVAYAPDGKQLASVSWGRTLKLWDASTGVMLRRAYEPTNRHFASLAFSHDGRIVAAGSADGSIMFYDPVTGERARTLRSRAGKVDSISFSLDNRWLAVSGWTYEVPVLDVPSGEKALGLNDAPQNVQWRSISSGASAHPFTDAVYAVAFSPDGHWLAAGDLDSSVRLWRTEP